MTLLKTLPNIITFLNLFCGFASVYFSFTRQFDMAAMAIMLATIFDMLDGRLARILGVSSDMGKELDSFSDLVTFGIAPAFLALNIFFILKPEFSPWFLIPFAFLYVVAATIRLAMYNIKTGEKEVVKNFTGMPSTLAGISIATIFGFDAIPCFLDRWFTFSLNLPFWALALLFLVYAFLMVSKIKYPKSNSKLLNFRGFWNIIYNLFFLAFLLLILKYFLLFVAVYYILSPILRFRIS